MSLAAALTRLDETALQEILGAHVVRLLRLLDRDLARPSSLLNLLQELVPPPTLLRDQNCRRVLFESLSRDGADQLLKALDLMDDGNVYRTLVSTKFRKNSKLERTLFEFFSVSPISTDVAEKDGSITSLVPSYPLFRHQREAVSRVLGFLYQAHSRRVLLHMPTGSGKTRTAMNIICEHLRRQEPTLVTWLAYSEELCSQACEEFSKAWMALGNREVPVYRAWGEHRLELTPDARDGFVVAGLGKLYSEAMKRLNYIASLADRTSLVIIDEAHQATAETYRFVLEFMVEKTDSSRLLGLSATPGRTWNDMDEDERLARFFCKQKVSLRVDGYQNPVQYLIDSGYLAKPNFVALNYSGAVELAEKDLSEMAQALDIPATILRRLAEDEQRNLRIVHKVEELARRHSRIIVFAATVDHAKLLGTVLRARGLHADTITGETQKHERGRLIQRFRSSALETRILCNYGVLTTGFDAPKTSCALIARPTKSLVLYSQMVGRAIRGPNAGGNAEAEIVTVVDQALPGFRDPGEAFTNWEDVWN